MLFAVVQTVTFTAALRSGERPGLAGWSGLAAAALVLLFAPGASRLDVGGALLMAVAGLAWAGYTLRGRGSGRPLHVSAGNFVRSVPLVLLVLLVLLVPALIVSGGAMHVGARGVMLAVMSGAAASGLAYALWYSVLPSLTRVQTGLVQLPPAPLAAMAGLVLIGEHPHAAGAAVLAADLGRRADRRAATAPNPT